MKNEEKLKQLYKLLDEIKAYERGLGKIYFDIDCVAPEKGKEQAGEDAAVIGMHLFKLQHSKKYLRLLSDLYHDGEGLTSVQKRAVQKLYESYQKTKNVSQKLSYKADLVFNKSRNDWLKAKTHNDYSLFRDSFKAVIDMTNQLISLRDDRKQTPYDTLLDDYEAGGSIASLDAFFSKLKKHIIPLVKRIQKEGKPIRDDFLSRPVPIENQDKFSRYLLELEGLDKGKLVFMTTEHPFTDHYGSNDIRVTTHFYEDNFISNIFSTLHEGGHALFMQNEPEEFYKYYAADNMTSAMHECISRFYENIIGRSEEFVSFIMPTLRKISGNTFDDISEKELYEAINIAKPNLIRMDADELTYSIHIMIRYELEKEFVNGNITVDEIPALWNSKYKEYLGLDVPDDEHGCLQDVHWSGSYGYFPSYALGNAYGAQILNTMKKDIDVFGFVRQGRLDEIGNWLTKNVFSCASMLDPDEWIKKITGEKFNVSYYIDYLENKFKKIYDLKD